MTRILALLAALSGLTVMAVQGVALGITMTGYEASPELVNLVLQIGRWAQLAFFLLVTLFMFLFALTKRSAA